MLTIEQSQALETLITAVRTDEAARANGDDAEKVPNKGTIVDALMLLGISQQHATELMEKTI